MSYSTPGYGQQPATQAFGQPTPAQPQMSNPEDSFGSWMLTLFLMGIPLVGFIYALMLAFGSSASESKKNWARATLAWMVIGVVVGTIVMILFGGVLMSLLDQQGYSSY